MSEQLTLPTRAVPDKTLAEAIHEMRQKVEDGTRCPCCGRLVKLYRRKLHSEMAAFLCRLVRRYREEPRYYSTRELCPALTKSSTDGSYLVLWDLIEREPIPGQNESGGRAGMYRPTEHGMDFVSGRTTVKSHVLMLCGEPVGFSDDYIHIEAALGDRFNYAELMGLEPGGDR